MKKKVEKILMRLNPYIESALFILALTILVLNFLILLNTYFRFDSYEGLNFSWNMLPFLPYYLAKVIVEPTIILGILFVLREIKNGKNS